MAGIRREMVGSETVSRIDRTSQRLGYGGVGKEGIKE